MMFRSRGDSCPCLMHCQARGAEVFAAFRMLELGAHASRGVPVEQCQNILSDAWEAHAAAISLAPPTVLS